MTTIGRAAFVLATSGAALAACGTSAGARGAGQDQAVRLRDPGSRAHDFLTLDRPTPVSSMSLESRADYSFGENTPRGHPGVPMLSLDYAAHVVSRWGLGAHFHLPTSYQVDQTQPALGGILLGGMFSRRVKPWAHVIVHGGVTLPTATDLACDPSDGADIPEEVLDATRVPGPWLRLGASPIVTVGRWFFRIDLGFDYPVPDGEREFGRRYTFVPEWRAFPFMRVNAGAGIETRHADYTLELTNTKYRIDHTGLEYAGRDGDLRRSTLALAARLNRWNLRPGLALVLGTIDRPPEDRDQMLLAVVASLTVNPFMWRR